MEKGHGLVCAPSHHVLWSLVNGTPSRKCQEHRSSWKSSQEKASVLEHDSTNPYILLKEKAHRGSPHMLRKPHNAHPSSRHTHSGTNQQTAKGSPPTHIWGCSAKQGLFGLACSFLCVCKNLLILDCPFLILSSVTCNKLMLHNVLDAI